MRLRVLGFETQVERETGTRETCDAFRLSNGLYGVRLAYLPEVGSGNF